MSDRKHRLVLLPGLHGTDGLFAPLQRALPSGIEPIPIIYPLDHLTLYSEVLPYILKRVPDGRFSVLGDSYSGPLALMVANALPDRVDAVILSASFVTNPLRRPFRWARAFAYAPFVRIAPMRMGASMLLANGLSRVDGLDHLVREIRTVSPRVIAGRLRESMDGDFRDAAARCIAPILYLHALSDRIVGDHTLRELLAANPNVREQGVDAPHALLFVNPADAAAHIADFLKHTVRATIRTVNK